MASEVTDKNIENELLNASRDGVARKIVTYWDHLKFVMKDSNPPMDLVSAPPKGTELLAIAEDAIKSRKIKLRFIEAGVEKDIYFDLKDLDARVEAFKKKHENDKEFTAGIDAMGGKLSDMVPTYNAIAKTAKVTEQGVAEAGGFLSKAWNFISGLLKWVARAVQALLSSKPIPGFWDTVAKTAAPDAQGKVQTKLQAAAASDKEVDRFLSQRDENGKSVMDSIGEKVHDGAYKTLGVARSNAPANTPALPPLDTLKPLGTGVTAEYFKEGVKRGILDKKTSDGKPELEETVKAALTVEVAAAQEEMWRTDPRRYVSMEKTIIDDSKKMSDTIAGAIANTIADPKNRLEIEKRRAKPEDLAKYMAEKITAEIAKKQGEYEIPLDFASEAGKKKLKRFEDKIAAVLAEKSKYDMLQEAISLAALIKAPALSAANDITPALTDRINLAGVHHDPAVEIPADGNFVGAAPGSPQGTVTDASPRISA